MLTITLKQRAARAPKPELYMNCIQVTEFGSSEVLTPTECEPPIPDENQVVIDIEAIGVNFADVLQRRGEYIEGPTPPFVPGMEAAGKIKLVGEGVDREVGESVIAMVNYGAYAEEIAVSKYALFDTPQSISLEEAAAVPVQFLTAHSIIHEWGKLEESERVLVHAAAGGVGSIAVQLADAVGAEIFATASTQEKLDLARTLGADHGINYTESDFAEEVLSRTDGEGVDFVLDGVGGDVFHDSLDALSHFGRIVPYGDASGVIPSVDTGRLRFENKTVIGFHLGQAMVHDYSRIRSAQPELMSMLENDELQVTIDRTFPLEAASKAHECLENRENKGKVVLTP